MGQTELVRGEREVLKMNQLVDSSDRQCRQSIVLQIQ